MTFIIKLNKKTQKYSEKMGFQRIPLILFRIGLSLFKKGTWERLF